MNRLDVAVIGAGPFGFSIAAHLPNASVRVYGRPMETWRTTMPKDMLLRSAWDETSLSAPGDRGSIVDWARREGIDRTGPIPLSTFLAYADWFRGRFVRDHDPSDVVNVARRPDGFAIRTAAGDEVLARRVALAIGVTPFAYAPEPLAGLVGDGRVRSAIQLRGFEQFDKQRVIVVGGGQAALETAGLAARAGGDVELLSRSPIRWFADREPDRPRSPLRQRLYRLAYPAVGYGPPPINRIVLHPDLFARLPFGARRTLSARLLRAGGSPWLRGLVDGHVKLTEGVTVREVASAPDGLRVALDDGSERTVDDVVVATGYRFGLQALSFLDPALQRAVRVDRGWPVLDRYFRSTDRDLVFVGYPAEGRFGPISRFVLGTRFTAARAAPHLAS